MGKDHQDTKQDQQPTTPVPADAGMSALLAEMLATIREMRADNAAMRAELASVKEEAKAAAEGPKRPEPVVPAKQAWEEEIWVEAMMDCTYPDPPSHIDPEGSYGIYRKAAKPDELDKDGNPAIGALFRLKYREHLAGHMRVLSEEEVQDRSKILRRASARPHVPQTTARGVKLNNQF